MSIYSDALLASLLMHGRERPVVRSDLFDPAVRNDGVSQDIRAARKRQKAKRWF